MMDKFRDISIFVSGAFFGGVFMAIFVAYGITFVMKKLRLHNCPGHFEHEAEMANPNIKKPTPTL